MKIGIYQVAFNDECLRAIDPEFIRYFNSSRDQFFENSVIIDIYKSGRYKLFDFTGVVSWRFKQKTDLTGPEVLREINNRPDYDVFNLSPHSYRWEQHPFNRGRTPQGAELARMIDQKGVLPFELYHYNTEGLNVWCNYFVIKKNLFALYVKNYLLPVVKYLKKPDPEIKEFISVSIKHRLTGNYTIVPFFLEGLFSVFCHREKLKVKTL